MVPGISEAQLEQEHVTRYRFACGFARGCDVLDAACGVGYSAPLLLEAGARSYLGVDINAEAVGLAKSKYQTDPAISFAVDDVCEFRHVPTQAFDLVVSFETIEHVPSPERFLANVKRALRPGGTFIVSTPHRLRYSPGRRLSSKPWNPYHVREWNQSEFVALLKPWFRVIDLLGQKPIPTWKARVVDLAATRPWLKTFLSAVKPAKASPSAVSRKPHVADRDVAPQRVLPWQAPLYTVCVAEARA